MFHTVPLVESICNLNWIPLPRNRRGEDSLDTRKYTGVASEYWACQPPCCEE